MRSNNAVDIVLFTAVDNVKQAFASSAADRTLSIEKFETACIPVVVEALSKGEGTDTVCVGDRLFDVVSVPIKGNSQELLGALTLGIEMVHKNAQDMKKATQCEIILLANGRVIASTAGPPELHNEFARMFSDFFNSSPISLDASGDLGSKPSFTRYSGVTDRAMVSPMASWKPSFAPFLNRYGWSW